MASRKFHSTWWLNRTRERWKLNSDNYHRLRGNLVRVRYIADLNACACQRLLPSITILVMMFGVARAERVPQVRSSFGKIRGQF